MTDSNTNQRKPIRHYVDNEKFLEAIIEYKKELQALRDKGVDLSNHQNRPLMSNYLGECFYKIAENYSHDYKFIGYKFRDEMVSDAVYFCVKYIDTFNPEKTRNPFAYFTTTCFNAFLQRIDKEKRELYTKYKVIENTEIFDGTYEKHAHEDRSQTGSSDAENIFYSEAAKGKRDDFVRGYEEKLNRAKNKAKAASAPTPAAQPEQQQATQPTQTPETNGKN